MFLNQLKIEILCFFFSYIYFYGPRWPRPEMEFKHQIDSGMNSNFNFSVKNIPAVNPSGMIWRLNSTSGWATFCLTCGGGEPLQGKSCMEMAHACCRFNKIMAMIEAARGFKFHQFSDLDKFSILLYVW